MKTIKLVFALVAIGLGVSVGSCEKAHVSPKTQTPLTDTTGTNGGAHNGGSGVVGG